MIISNLLLSVIKHQDMVLLPYSEHVTYYSVFSVASHNSFQKENFKSPRESLERFATIELDFWDDESLLKDGKPADWWVRHGLTGGSQNNSTRGFDSCLSGMKKWSADQLGHQVITVFLDKKQGWGNPGNLRLPIDLDGLLANVFPCTRLFTPSDVRGEHETVRSASKNRIWPQMKNLNGKVIFVLTGGSFLLSLGNQILHEYFATSGESVLAFVAPVVSRQDEITGIHRYFVAKTVGWVAFFNFSIESARLGRTCRTNGYVSRTWATRNGVAFRRAAEQGFNFIAVDSLEQLYPVVAGSTKGVFADP